MQVQRNWLRRLVFDGEDTRRFTQDSPILPDVWLSAGMLYCADPSARADLLLTPYKGRTPLRLAEVLRQRLASLPAEHTAATPSPRSKQHPVWAQADDTPNVLSRATWTISVNQTTVAVSATLRELIVAILPLSDWWRRNISVEAERPRRGAKARAAGEDRPERHAERDWLQRLVGVIAMCGASDAREADEKAAFDGIVADSVGQSAVLTEYLGLESQIPPSANRGDGPLLWSVSLNRPAFVAIDESVAATKADAARRVFNIDCSALRWAILDSGIDAYHPAFTTQDISGNVTTRVLGAFDFTRLRSLLSTNVAPSTGVGSSIAEHTDLEELDRQLKSTRLAMRHGRSLDWQRIRPLLDLHVQDRTKFSRPKNDHGTHVAGILAAGGKDDPRYVGVCPDIGLYDLRVLDDRGQGDEFSIIAALQFVRYLNANSDRPVIHGVNISLSLLHDVENYACGRTPICDECERLVNSGVVVVVAAGNRGYERVLTSAGELEAYRSSSVTDPGNSEAVITVGSTHRFQPHTYGVSYFSSRGPTGDGRIKPDLLAPGERIDSALVGGGYGPKDGTSMAAPHVSGVAALVMARHREFQEQPQRIKRLLCETATDLGRERYFQGSGMVDALRALQAV
jgi:subtilisin family serine protease